MKQFLQKTWKCETTGTEGGLSLFGVNIFDYEWMDTGKRALVYDPMYHQEFRFPIYTVEIDGDIQEFVAGEFSNGVWGFYLFQY
ncbi:MAG: hypothetical protein Q4A72_07275 [Bacillota bacterium]|nr:hypothetical protein [Bacillota bacterium]